MRVGILDYATNGRRSGVEYYTLGLIRSLAGQTEPSDLIVYTNDPAAVSEIHPRIIIREIPGRSHRTLRLLWQHVCLPRVAEADGLDVLHCPAYVMPLLPCRIPCVITILDIHALNQPQWCSMANRLHYRIAIPRSVRKAAGVIAVSEDTRTSILRHFGPLREDVRVIVPCIDDIFTPTPDLNAEDDCRRKYGLPEKYVLHVGNIEPRKNIPAAVEAVRRLREKGIDRTMVLAGQVRRGSRSLAMMMSDAQRQGIVQSLGYVARADLPVLYRMADALLCVSWHEGFGFPALEAMACGTPVISSMTGAMAETLGDAAMAVDADDIQSIANALVAVVSDQALRNRLRQEGLRRAASYQWTKSAAALLDAYKTAATRRWNRT